MGRSRRDSNQREAVLPYQMAWILDDCRSRRDSNQREAAIRRACDSTAAEAAVAAIPISVRRVSAGFGGLIPIGAAVAAIPISVRRPSPRETAMMTLCRSRRDSNQREAGLHASKIVDALPPQSPRFQSA